MFSGIYSVWDKKYSTVVEVNYSFKEMIEHRNKM